MILATTAVVVLPIIVVWVLRDHGVISSIWLGVLVAVVVSLLVSFIGAGYWKRHRGSDDLMFSELLLWGWLRRLYVERQVERATQRLTLARSRQLTRVDARTRQQRERLLTQLATALEAQDPYLKGHSRRVARHATMIARKMRLPGQEVARIRLGGALHDVGKLSIPIALLNKRAKLTTQEFEVVKRHAAVGAEMVACLGDPELTAMVRHHHERSDGSGYPAGLREEQIPLGARVIAVADTYDAITAARPYRPASPHKQAFDTLRAESMGHLDPAAVRALLACYSGRRALAFWEALVALPQGALAASGGTGVIAPRRKATSEIGRAHV